MYILLNILDMRLKLKVQIKLKHTEKETLNMVSNRNRLLETKFENYIWKYFFFLE